MSSWTPPDGPQNGRQIEVVEHPCKGMTKAQIAAFEAIAINQVPQNGWNSIDKLLARGVIERGPSETRRDAMGVYTIPHFYVPIAVHAQWCAWCSQQPDAASSDLQEQVT